MGTSRSIFARFPAFSSKIAVPQNAKVQKLKLLLYCGAGQGLVQLFWER
tara:strand:+ start:615 stop:761 length:147 start_codon:yes stop_codon:yes gene_type:complete